MAGAAPKSDGAAPVTPVDVGPVGSPSGLAPVTAWSVKAVCAVKEIRVSSSGMAGPDGEGSLCLNVTPRIVFDAVPETSAIIKPLARALAVAVSRSGKKKPPQRRAPATAEFRGGALGTRPR